MIPLPSPIKRAAAAILMAAVSVFGTAASATPQWQANDDDALVLELRSGKYRLGESMRGYQTPGGICIDMADLIQALNLPVRLDKKSRRATGWVFSEDETLVVDRDSYAVQTANTHRLLADGDIHDTPEGWCVATDALSNWLGVQFRPDLPNMVVVLESERKLPFLEAIERKNRAARLRQPGAVFDLAELPVLNVPYRGWRAPAVDMTIASEWRAAKGSGSRTDMRYELFASGEMLGASVDARLISDGRARPESLRTKAYRIDPDGGLLGPLQATQVAIGDVEAFAGNLTGQSTVGRGLFVSNRPITRSSRFAVTTLRGDLPVGWDAELYRNGQLLAFQSDRGDGRYEFADVELRFGTNAFEVVLYGPQGQVRREVSDYPVGNDNLPVGATYYWAGILQQDRDLIDFRRRTTNPDHGLGTGWRWGMGIEHGIDRRMTVGLGGHSLILRGQRRTYGEVSIRRAVGPMLVELGAARQLDGRSGNAFQGQMLGRIAGVNIRADVLWVDGGYESEVISAEESRAFGISLEQSLNLGGQRLPVQASLRHTRARDGSDVREWMLRSSLSLQGLSLTAELAGRNSSGPRANGDDGTRFSVLLNTMMGNVRLRGNGRFRLSGPEQGLDVAEVTAERALGLKSSVRGSATYQARDDSVDFAVGLVRHFRKFALRADARYSTRGSAGLGLSLAMSLGRDPVEGGWRLSANKLAQHGEAAVTVYRDENGDGLRQSDEEAVEGVEIAINRGLEQKRTNAAGRTLVNGLRPFARVLVNVDAGSIDDPLLMPKGRGVVLIPRPGVVAELELPLAPTGEVEGAIHGPDGEPRGGISLELVDGQGLVVAQTATEFDGYFLFDRVVYGRYRLRIAPASADVLDVQRDLPGSLALDRAHPVARAGVLRLQPQSRAPTGILAR
ncbi:MAG: carboxypeptidase-like regulatory domain-containing protein [Novosphingobium sp.]